MMNANNTYFENLKKIGHDWEVARAERQARHLLEVPGRRRKVALHP